MENANEIMEVTENVADAVEVATDTVKLTPGAGVLIGFAAIGVGATGYALYKLICFGIKKTKEAKAKKQAEQAVSEVADESTAE